MALEPLPLKGFMSAVGKAGTKSVLMPILTNTQFMAPTTKPSTPELRITLMATSMPTR
ncbi:hypothetical protein D3C83_183890 [compost metagenome]